jgi:hypothetical protein
VDDNNRFRDATANDFSWFRIQNYDDCKDFDLVTWADFLKDRLYRQSYIRGGAIATFEVYEPDIGICDNIELGKLQAVRFSSLGRSEGERKYGGASYSPFWDESHVVQSIEPLSISTVKVMGAGLPFFPSSPSYTDTFPDESRKWSADTGLEVSRAESEEDFPYDMVEKEAGIRSLRRCINIRIDLAAPDKVIVEELKRFLPCYRRALMREQDPGATSEGKIKPADIEKLHYYLVLPSIDIQIWAEYKRLRLKDGLIAELLSVDQTRFAQVYKPYYKKVFSFNFANALEHLAFSKSD